MNSRRPIRAKIGVAGLISLSLLAAACSKSSSTVASPTPAATPSLSASASATPTPATPQSIGNCKIEPKTDCRGDDLHGATLTSADIHSSTMSSTILRGADLHRANLRSVDFRKADLSGADLSYAKMQHSNLTGAHLSGADLSYANLSGANVATSQLQTATLCHTTLPDGSSDTSGCAGSSPSPSPKPSAHAVTITQFSVQSTIDCSTSTTVVAKYATTNATSVEFTINGQSPGASAGYDPSGGKAHLPFPCKKHNNAGRKATFAITASGKHKATATKSVTVTATG